MINSDPASKTILVVDDQESITTFFEALLSLNGFEVETASNGSDALNFLRKDSFTQYDLIILDLMMPGYGGYEVLKELQNEPYQTVPIVIVTARMLDSGTVEMIRNESNVVEFMQKPIEPKTFITSVHRILNTRPKKR